MNFIMYRDTTHLVVQGHEGWIDVAGTHYHAGHPGEVLFKWGHNMKPDGLCQKERLIAYVFDPEGNRKELSINEYDGESYAVSFIPEREGFYQVVVEQSGIVTVTADGKHLLLPKKDCDNPLESSAFTQFARAILPVGHDLEGKVERVGNALELVPLQWKTWKAGDVISLQVLYQEKPVAGATANLMSADLLGAGGPLAKETGEDGCVSFPLQQPGNYLLLVRHVDHTERREGYYDQRRLTATLPLIVIR